MNHDRSYSSPELIPKGDGDAIATREPSNDSPLEGVTTNVKLLMKMIQDHNDASKEDDGRKMQRLVGMLTILDDVKHRIQKSQTSNKKKGIVFRRCNTDLRPDRMPKDKKPPEPMDEKQKLLKQLNDSLVARKSLEKMFSSLGKEKAIITSELAKKVQELSGMEEQLNDLKEQNAMLLEKVQKCATKHKAMKKSSTDSDPQGSSTLKERNKALSEQLLKSLDGYRSAKRKMKEAREENEMFRGNMKEMVEEITTCMNRIHAIQQRVDEDSEIKEELTAVEHILRYLEIKVSSDKSEEM